ILSQTSTSVTLGWNRSSAYDFETYEILYTSEPIGVDNYLILNRSSIALLASQAAESINITGLTQGSPYYFRIRAKDKNDLYSNLSNEVWINVQLPEPVFAIVPESKNFGIVVAGTPASQIFTVSNAGTGSLGINSITLSGTDAAQFLLTDNITYPLALSAGESIIFNLSFLPFAEGSFSAYLTIIDNLYREIHMVNLSAVCTDSPNHGGGDISTTAGGYYFANNLSITAPAVPNYNWIEQTSAAVNPASISGSLDDGYWGPIALGFNFSFYGNIYNEFYLSTNGFLKFDSGASQSSNAQIPSRPNPDNIIALFWDDLEYYPGFSNIYYGSGSSAFVITYDHLGRSGTAYNAQNSVTAQVLLYPDGRIKLQYQEVTGNLHSPSIGIENSNGSKGLQYHYNGDGGPYTLDGFRSHIAVMFGTNEYTLPVELSAFTAIVSAQNYVVLNWTTQTETNLAGFYLYRGQDALLSNAMRIPSLIAATNTSQETDYVFTDSEVDPEHIYYYWLQSLEINSESEFHGPISVIIYDNNGDIPLVPVVTMLLDAYPNPFQPPLHLPYKLAAPGSVAMHVYNIKGQLIWSNLISHNKAGHYQMLWNGSDLSGNPVCSGVYFYQMTCGNYSEIKKTFLLK
ncbi:MAG: choice-of-anchor D domain-containing protein, partial [Candidatus Cloacimonadaceae bacterium]